ncbi:rhodanese-like domain-containing protein [Pseudokineococcus marinus]|uniref:Rhodanese-like domain-containing protein n=1 Tax=Pseudokineococcus marinus TaxID=351215 RepID=A0A849BSA4_9ACTN|nr:rhodanese-like domain-containing protein [Pseudokineococcus marinus]NNH24293.1 rhodanese-like domain-containing protein [Pseudokineococcus marinus]
MSDDQRRVPAADVPEDAVLVDVREDDEWAAGHAPGAVHIPLGDLPARVGELPEGDVHVVCRSGGRSARAAAWLQQNGVDAVDVAGGMGAWYEAERPMVSESGQEPRVL